MILTAGKLVYNGTDIKNASSMVYNASSSTSATSGWVHVGGYEKKLAQWCVATYSAATILMRIEGKTNDINRQASLVATKLVAQTSGPDRMCNLSDYCYEYMRIGFRVDASAGNNCVYAGFAYGQE